MKVLVTGHHGYIGSVAAPMLAEAGHEVTGLDTYFYEGCDFVGEIVDFPTVSMDVRDVTEDTPQGYDAIVHLAALSNDPLGELDADLTREINFRATVELARKAKEAGVRRFVFASSCSMYGASGTDGLMTEEAPLRPLTAYAESKVRAEEALSELADADFAPVYMRNATAYGASPRVRFDVVLNNLAAWAFTSGKVLIMSDGTPWRPLVHVRDIAAAAAAVLAAPVELVANQAFNVGANSENYRVRELAEIVYETFPGCEIEYAEGAGPDPRSYRVDFSKLAETLPDATPSWTARDGARELLDAFRSVALASESFEMYTRLSRLKSLVDAGSLDDELRWSRARERSLATGDNSGHAARIVVTRETASPEPATASTHAPSVSILIPTHEDAPLLRKSLPVFLTNAPRAVEVVILNNDPPQDVSGAISEHGADPRVRILEMGYEAGFARAINRGIRESSAELVMFCDADLFPSAGYLSEMLSFFERRPLAGAAIGKILRYELDADGPTEVIDTAGLDLNRQRRFTPPGEGELDRGQLDAEMEVFGLDGAAMIVRRAALESIRFRDEYLDEDFVTHKEDHDVSWRLRLAGWQCWYVPAALAHHARTTRGLGSTKYRSAPRTFHQNELDKAEVVRMNAMKNQWLMLLKNEDLSNFIRDFPFIFGREVMIVTHSLLFAPKTLAAIPMTLRLVPQTLEKRRAAKRSQRMEPRALRFWLGGRKRVGPRVKEHHR